MAWNLSGMYYENCSCTATCPCTWSLMQYPATTERCNANLAFAIESGEIEGTDMSGRSFALIIDAPALMSEGGWNVGLIIDDGAEQRLGRVQADIRFEVKAGGLVLLETTLARTVPRARAETQSLRLAAVLLLQGAR